MNMWATRVDRLTVVFVAMVLGFANIIILLPYRLTFMQFWPASMAPAAMEMRLQQDGTVILHDSYGEIVPDAAAPDPWPVPGIRHYLESRRLSHFLDRAKIRLLVSKQNENVHVRGPWRAREVWRPSGGDPICFVIPGALQSPRHGCLSIKAVITMDDPWGVAEPVPSFTRPEPDPRPVRPVLPGQFYMRNISVSSIEVDAPGEASRER